MNPDEGKVAAMDQVAADAPLAHDALPPPVYLPAADTLILYEGSLTATHEGVAHEVPGRVELELKPSLRLAVSISGSEPWISGAAFGSDEVEIAVPARVSLSPNSPGDEKPEPTGSHTTLRPLVNRLTAGDIGAADQILLSVFGRLPSDHRLERDGSFSLNLEGWTADVVAIDIDETVDHGMSVYVRARPAALPITAKSVDQLRETLYFVFSLAASREIGVGPAAGLDSAGAVVWADWFAPRHRPGKAGIRWCPDWGGGPVLQDLVDGFSGLGSDAALIAASKRSTNMLLTADGSEVLDVRILIGCNGLELLSWAVLQRHGWLTAEALDKATAATSLRLLLQWAEIPIEIPDHFEALNARRARLGKADWAGPETLFSVRNRLVHPPKRIDSPLSPSSRELVESWQLTTWYLELALLRVLEYRGHYWCRLRLGRWAGENEPVPWALLSHDDGPAEGSAS